MKISTVTYMDWKLEVDRKSTEKIYSNIENPGAERCGCHNCRNFGAQREWVFPEEIKRLFIQLGIDYEKEMEISHFAKLENGQHYYNGWFHFKGRFYGKDCSVPLPSGGHTFDLTPVTQDFHIGFWQKRSLAIIEEKNDLVQVEFDCWVPWMIEEALEPE